MRYKDMTLEQRREYHKIKARERRARDPAKAAAYQREWQQNNRERRREYDREYYKRDKNRAAAVRRRMYGLHDDDYTRMMEQQEGKCAICRTVLAPGKATHVDHCHQTGIVRGLLCTRCNTAIGLFDEDITRLDQAAGYLMSASDQRTKEVRVNKKAAKALTDEDRKAQTAARAAEWRAANRERINAMQRKRRLDKKKTVG